MEGLDRLQEGNRLHWSVLLLSSWHQEDCEEQIVMISHTSQFLNRDSEQCEHKVHGY